MNRTVTLVRYALIHGKGWRRGAVIYQPNGRLKQDAMSISGEEVHCPNGRFQIRQFQGSRSLYIDLGNNPVDALSRFKAEKAKLKNTLIAVETAKAAGLELVQPSQPNARSSVPRKTARQRANEFILMHLRLPHRSDDSVKVYERVCDTFLEVSKAKYADKEERVIELPSRIVPKLQQWLKENPDKVLVFGTENDKPDTKMLLGLKVTARRAGMNCGRCAGCKKASNECREFTLHRFRRTYTTRLLRASNGDLRSVMARTGHTDIASVMRYLEPSAALRSAVEAAF